MFKKMLISFALLNLVACGRPDASQTLSAPAAGSEQTTVTLTDAAEVALAVKLVNQVDAPLVVAGACSSQTVTLREKSCGFAPSRWTVSKGDDLVPLKASDIGAAVAMVNRLKVQLQGNDACTGSEVTIKGRSCGLSPNQWTASYLKGAAN